MNTTHWPETKSGPKSTQEAWLESVCRKRVLKALESIRHGRLLVREGARAWSFGESAPSELGAMVEVNDPIFWTEVALGGDLGAAESWMDGRWTSRDVLGVCRLFLRNRHVLNAMNQGWARVKGPLLRAMHALRRNTLSGSRSNIAAHYDLGNDFFQLFLDPTAMYSSAWWEHPDQSLEEASIAKLDRICQKLELTSSDHLLEIGTGWGGFAIHAARITGCRVTTTTISKEQHILAVERVHKAGLADRVTVLLEDYRDLQGEFDKVVSIEMLEAVGHQYLGEWFEAVDRLVKPGGNVVVQVITVPDQAWKGHTKRVDFIKKHIFPGSCLVSTGALLEAAGERTRMSMDWMEEMGLHYARTLSEWRHRFHLNKLKARGQGFDDRFLRMWDYYFAYCEAGFTERSIGLIQVRFQKPGRQCRLSAPVNQRKDKLLVGGPAA